ncbi:MAG: HAD-IA family hydrolase [Bacteroidetes bacterium]|nr:HAD-IA family hydrolase [Bacteroidota bacterium]
MSIALVVFDIAGTTVKDNGEIAIAFREAMKKFGYDIPSEAIMPLMGYKKTVAIKMMLDDYEPDETIVTEDYINRIHAIFEQSMVDYYTHADQIEPLPYAETVFHYLKEKQIRIGLDTGFSRAITDVIINRLGWLQQKLVDIVVCSDEVQEGRPSPFMIQKMMEASGVADAQKVIKVGDTESDINEGWNAGCLYSIGVTTGAFAREEMEPFEPSHIINSLNELIPIIAPLL